MSRTVFFGKIPYDYTEEQVLEVARSVGPVKEVRLVFDKETAKSKGFAFVEYLDRESAASAVRNLNNYQVGTQKLRVDFSTDGPGSQHYTESESSTQSIAALIDDMKSEERAGFLTDFKNYSAENHQNATALLENNPHLAYALVQTMITQQKINSNQADKLVQRRDNKASESPVPEVSTRSTVGSSDGGSNTVGPSGGSVGAPISAPTPAPAPAPVPAPAAPSTVDENQRQMIRQVMSFTPQQIESLPQEQRAAVMDLRSRVERGDIVL